MGHVSRVDDRLALFTKGGRLIIARVSRSGFQREEEIQVFRGRTFCAPAFGKDTFYVRSLEEIAAIKVIPISDK